MKGFVLPKLINSNDILYCKYKKVYEGLNEQTLAIVYLIKIELNHVIKENSDENNLSFTKNNWVVNKKDIGKVMIYPQYQKYISF